MAYMFMNSNTFYIYNQTRKIFILSYWMGKHIVYICEDHKTAWLFILRKKIYRKSEKSQTEQSIFGLIILFSRIFAKLRVISR